jgi:hypothetical protein
MPVRSRARVLGFCALIAAVAIAVATGNQLRAQGITTFNVTAFGATAYRFAELGTTNNPTLSLLRGTTYTFNVNAAGHPFFIATSGMNAAATPFTTGVTGNNVQTGVLTFAVPASAPATLFYQCGVHNAMSGTIQITSPPAASVPAVGFTSAALLGGALLLLALVLIRRRGLD